MEKAILNISVLGSGSSGNAIYIESPNIRILIDAGLSARELNRRLEYIGRCPEEIGAVLISHEHIDHVRGAEVLTKRYGIPLYLSEGTYLGAPKNLGQLKEVCYFSPGKAFFLADLWIEPFSVPHDANDPVGFNICLGENKISIALDMGYTTRLVQERMREAHLIVLESNHDTELLKIGPYPWHLKQRILGKRGHLSNDESSAFLQDLLHPGLSHVILAHLSRTNNRPELAQVEAQRVIQDHEVILHLARQDRPTALIALGEA